MNVKIKRLTETATLPTKAHSTDACFDIYADCPDAKYKYKRIPEQPTDGHGGVLCVYLEPIEEIGDGIAIQPRQSVTIHTGFATEIPEGYFAAVYPRSGMGIKRHLRLSNSTGIIDAPYRNEWLVSLYNDGDEVQIIKHGDRIAQFVIMPVLDVTLVEADTLNETDRGLNGLGSSGR